MDAVSLVVYQLCFPFLYYRSCTYSKGSHKGCGDCTCLPGCENAHCCESAWQGKRSELPYDDYRREAEERTMQDGLRAKQADIEAPYPPAPVMQAKP